MRDDVEWFRHVYSDINLLTEVTVWNDPEVAALLISCIRKPCVQSYEIF